MKIIKSNSVNFSKSCNFGLQTDYQQPSDEEIQENARKLDEELKQARGETAPEYVPSEQKVETYEKEPDSFYETFAAEQRNKIAQNRNAAAQRNLEQEMRTSDLGGAGDAFDAGKTTLNNEDIHTGQMNALRGKDVTDHFDKMMNRSKYGDLVDQAVSPVLGAGKSAASALGGLLSKFDTTKNAGEKLKKKAEGFDSEYAGTTAGNWADDHKVASGAIGAGALLGAGLLAKKGYDLMKGKKELQANAYYAFEGSDINKNSLIGGPYSTRKDARDAHPDATHILKGSTLGAYGDFEVAS